MVKRRNWAAAMRAVFAAAVVLLPLGVSAGCLQRNKALGQREFVLLSAGQERSLGKSTAHEVEQKYKLSKNRAHLTRVERIGNELAVYAPRNRELKGYVFHVLKTKAVNAFAAPGGFIYVTEGLLNKLQPTDDELACVLGHEIGHVEARHSVKQMQVKSGLAVLREALSVSKETKAVGKVVGVGGGLLSLRYSRGQERQADELGVELAAAAGYDPRAMLGFFRKLRALEKKQGGSAVPAFLRTHPLTADRIKFMDRHLRRLESGRRRNRFLRRRTGEKRR